MSTHNMPFINIRKEITLNYHKSKRDRNSRGKRDISVRAIEVLLYIDSLQK